VIASFRAADCARGDSAAVVRLIDLWHEQLTAADRRQAAPTKLTNTDGHDVAAARR
jgi:hypothetical protein